MRGQGDERKETRTGNTTEPVVPRDLRVEHFWPIMFFAVMVFGDL